MLLMERINKKLIEEKKKFYDSTNYSKFHHLQKFILMKFPKIIQPRK